MSNLFLIILIISIIIIVITILTVKVFIPTYYIDVGDKLHVYIGCKYNRTATVNSIDKNEGLIFIYGDFPLPYTYQGRFYSTGYMSDGNKLIFIKNKKLLIPTLLAELIRF